MNLDIDLSSPQSDIPRIEILKPSFEASYRLAIIGESPSEDDFESGQPFSSKTGQFFTNVLGSVGIQKSVCLMGYLCQFKGRHKVGSWEMNESNAALGKALLDFQPNLILLLGSRCMLSAGYGYGKTDESGINVWRGSLVKCVEPVSPFFGFKCLATYDPYEIITTKWTSQPIWQQDLKRAREDAEFPELRRPPRVFELRPSVEYIVSEFRRFRATKNLVSLDIEGGIPNITCCSFTDNPLTGFIVPFHEFSGFELTRILKEMSLLLADETVPKVLQNGLYDMNALARVYNMVVRNMQHDTMLACWELYPELPKALGVQTSLMTREPYYKEDRTKDDRDTHFEYCCKDSAVTLEIINEHKKHLAGTPLEHYQFNMDMLRPALYMQLRGINYDGQAAKEQTKICTIEAAAIQQRLDTMIGRSLNVNSPKQACEFLYDEKHFPVQHPKKKVGRGLDMSKRTANEDACLKLFNQFSDPALVTILQLRRKLKEKTFCELKYDADGRIRSGYNVVGTVTGRMSSSKTADGTGFNLTTIPKKFRKFYQADENKHFFQCDLAGADGWTVAAHCLQLGDPTMYEDYMFGLKPAKIIALLYKHGAEVNKWSRDRLKDESRAINEEGPGGWLYFTCKRAQHASNYLTGGKQMSDQILKDSYKKDGKLLDISAVKCKQLQDLYMRTRYTGVLSWQSKIKLVITQSRGLPELPCASGHVRKFFGRPRDHKTLRDACAHEPQANTTYATNLAALNLWNDTENRNTDGSLIVEPLHQVHDALCGQFPKDRTEWAVGKIRQWFNNELTIAGMSVTIPFDGFYGPSWGHCAEGSETGMI